MKDIRGIDLRLLLYFVTVAQCRSFSKAAVQLNMAQPPLSQQIRTLEGRLGVTLFKRDKRRVDLTEAGAALLPEAEDILSRTREAVQHVRRVASGQAGRLRVGMVGSTPHDPYVLETLKRFGQKYPDVAIDLTQTSTVEQRKALLDGEADIALHWPWPHKASADLETLEFPPHRFCMALAEGHQLAGRKSLHPSALEGENWILPGTRYNPSWHAMATEVFGHLGFAPQRFIERSSAPLILALVAAGQGVAVVPRFIEEIAHGVSFVDFPASCRDIARLNLCLTRRKDGGAAARAFFDVAAGVAKARKAA